VLLDCWQSLHAEATPSHAEECFQGNALPLYIKGPTYTVVGWDLRMCKRYAVCGLWEGRVLGLARTGRYLLL
jgi:hypothetical protein